MSAITKEVNMYPVKKKPNPKYFLPKIGLSLRDLSLYSEYRKIKEETSP